MTSLSSEFKNLSPSKKGENFVVFVRPLNTVGGRPGNLELIVLGEVVIKPWR